MDTIAQVVRELRNSVVPHFDFDQAKSYRNSDFEFEKVCAQRPKNRHHSNTRKKVLFLHPTKLWGKSPDKTTSLSGERGAAETH